MPPESLLVKAAPLSKPPVPTTRALVSRTLSSEKAYDEVASRLNALIDWIYETAP